MSDFARYRVELALRHYHDSKGVYWYYDVLRSESVILYGAVRYLNRGSCMAAARRLAAKLECEVTG